MANSRTMMALKQELQRMGFSDISISSSPDTPANRRRRKLGTEPVWTGSGTHEERGFVTLVSNSSMRSCIVNGFTITWDKLEGTVVALDDS